MKFVFEEEDSIYNILLGFFVIGMTGRYFSIPYAKYIAIPAFALAIILAFLDIIHTVHDMSFNPMMLVGLFINNIIEIIIFFAMLLKATGFKLMIPYFTQYIMPLTSTTNGLFAIGIFLIVTSVFWLFSLFFR